MIMSPQKSRILVADDEVDLADTYAAILRNAGYEAETAASGREAANLLNTSEFDVVVSDVLMPDMDGIELLRTIREDHLDIPVILITGSPSLRTAAQALEYGAHKYLVKPVSEAELLEKVGEAMWLHRIAKLKRETLEQLVGEAMLGDRAGLESHFDKALQDLWIAYQPIVRAKDGTVYGHEALVRSADRALSRPATLFDAATRLGRLHELGQAIRTRVARELSVVGATGPVFVNLHPLDLAHDALYEPSDPLRTNPKAIVYEITERARLDEVPDVRSRVSQLRQAGFRIAIDDLGAGYAGLTSFTVLEPDVVKLDMTLIRGLDRDSLKRRLVASMTSLCKELGILTVAEGVETAGERDALVDLGCDLLQGFLFGRPAAPTP
jgi:EAL domain-containing protein (putative c-di-GMP-specific phosphodiesterase class I)/CheY-like chemotaxis protein